jgi:hypothetical protein
MINSSVLVQNIRQFLTQTLEALLISALPDKPNYYVIFFLKSESLVYPIHAHLFSINPL